MLLIPKFVSATQLLPETYIISNWQEGQESNLKPYVSKPECLILLPVSFIALSNSTNSSSLFPIIQVTGLSIIVAPLFLLCDVYFNKFYRFHLKNISRTCLLLLLHYCFCENINLITSVVIKTLQCHLTLRKSHYKHLHTQPYFPHALLWLPIPHLHDFIPKFFPPCSLWP